MSKKYVIHFIIGTYDKFKWTWNQHDLHVFSPDEEQAVKSLHKTLSSMKHSKKLLVFKVDEAE